MLYKIIIAKISIAEEEIQFWLNKGWEPLGPPSFRFEECKIYQILIKKEAG